MIVAVLVGVLAVLFLGSDRLRLLLTVLVGVGDGHAGHVLVGGQLEGRIAVDLIAAKCLLVDGDGRSIVGDGNGLAVVGTLDIAGCRSVKRLNNAIFYLEGELGDDGVAVRCSDLL